jgi:hypothetical protein
MEEKNQVASLQLSNILNSLGVPQESLFWWGITKAYLSDIELGRRKISDRIYKKLWEIFE